MDRLQSLSFIWTIFVACVFNVPSINSLDNGVALTPPMGWMSWERFRCTTDCKKYPDQCISENLFKRIADLMVSEGYLAAGYEYVIIDDCWLADTRDENGRLQPNAERFPNGIKALADYIHNLGLKFGIYEDIGTNTCAGYPGINGSYKLDAETFSEWDVDYIKVDGCYMKEENLPSFYETFGKALNETNRKIVYSCSWPAYDGGLKSDYKALAKYCNLWRNYGDIEDTWGAVKDIITWYGNHQDVFAGYAGPGHWNDPDMLILGNFGLNYEQSKAQMALWAVLAAPLIMSNDLATVEPRIKEVLQNEEVIAINQDGLGIQGRRIHKSLGIEIWMKPLTSAKNETTGAIAVLNRSIISRKVHVRLEKILGVNEFGYYVKDVFSGKCSCNCSKCLNDKPLKSLTVTVKATGVVLLKAQSANGT